MGNLINVDVDLKLITVKSDDSSVIKSAYVSNIDNSESLFEYKGSIVRKVIVYSTRHINQDVLIANSLEYRRYIGDNTTSARKVLHEFKLDVDEAINCIFKTDDGIFMMSPKGGVINIDTSMLLGKRRA